MTIDMHSHWRPPALIEALRKRKKLPRIETDAKSGVEVLKSRMGATPVGEVFDSVEKRLADMDANGFTTAALSLLGQFQWIERLPVAESLPLVRLYNDSVSEICRDNPGRFVAYASLPLAEMDAAVAELDRAIALPGIIGAQIPGNAFLTAKHAEQYRPLLAAADRHRAVLFIHWGPRPGDKWPRVEADTDNMSPRLGTLDMQASLSADMMTLCYGSLLDEFPNAIVQVHNLGGNIPYEVERLDHRNLLDTPEKPMPSTRFRKPNLYVDCNSFGPRAIEAGVRIYGADRIVCGTDGTGFGCEWTRKALDEADIGDEARRAILHDNAARMLAHLAPVAPVRVAAE